MIVGVNAIARAVGHAAGEREARIIIASHHKQAAQQLAQALECRFVQWEALYSTMHDAIVVCDDERDQVRSKSATGEAGLHPGYLKAGMVVMDLTAPRPTAFLRGAKSRGCGVVYPRQLVLEQIALQASLLTGQHADVKLLRDSLSPFFEED
jgi:shikimate 5-dehydrogenase